MQVKVQTVSELTINQLSEDQYKAEKAAGRINAGEVYACTPSPVKWEDIQNKPNVSGGGGDVDFQELARRIPSWQWKVTMPKTTHQTVTATVGEQTYTDDFYAPQGSKVAFSAKADTGYIAGNISAVNTTLSKDLIVTITAAMESEEVEAGEKELEYDSGRAYFEVPPKVHVIKCLWNSKDVYIKINPGDRLEFRFERTLRPPLKPGFEDAPTEYVYNWTGVMASSKDGSNRRYRFDVLSGESSQMLKIFWSKEINEHAVDYDWTK